MSDIARERCRPCDGSEPALSWSEAEAMLDSLDEWNLEQRKDTLRLRKRFRFADFAAAAQFTAKVAEAAEAVDHHPRIVTEWGRVTVDWWTHAIGGLHRNDFIMAARTDELYDG